VAPFAPEPPFQIYADGEPPIAVESARAMQMAASRGGSEFTILTPVKIRPILVVSERLDPYNEVLALRLKRLDKLSEESAEAVRGQSDVGLFYLSPDSVPGLKVENSAIITSLLKLPTTALDTTTELGSINENELRVIHERIADAHGLRLDLPVLKRAQELMAEIAARDPDA
jgi:hypothetical protein